jgi:hypothetical protein
MLLLKPPTFELGKSGHRVVAQEVILQACGNRQGHIGEIVSRMPDPLAVPAAQEAAASG